MNPPPEEENKLAKLFAAKEAEFQENLYKSWAMAERDSTYDAVKDIAIALLTSSHVTYSVDDLPYQVVEEAITIHEQIRKYSEKEQANAKQLPQQND